jgi:hypothetical protein
MLTVRAKRGVAPACGCSFSWGFPTRRFALARLAAGCRWPHGSMTDQPSQPRKSPKSPRCVGHFKLSTEKPANRCRRVSAFGPCAPPARKNLSSSLFVAQLFTRPRQPRFSSPALTTASWAVRRSPFTLPGSPRWMSRRRDSKIWIQRGFEYEAIEGHPRAWQNSRVSTQALE